MVAEVIDERRPNTQENGRDMETAPVPIFPICMKIKNITFFSTRKLQHSQDIESYTLSRKKS